MATETKEFLVKIYENGKLIEERIDRDLRARPKWDEPSAFGFIDEAIYDVVADLKFIHYEAWSGNEIWGYLIDEDNNKIEFEGYYGKDYAVVEIEYGNKKYKIEIEEL